MSIHYYYRGLNNSPHLCGVLTFWGCIPLLLLLLPLLGHTSHLGHLGHTILARATSRTHISDSPELGHTSRTLRKTHHISDISDTQYSPMPHLGHTSRTLRKTHHISDISDTQYSPMPHLGHTSRTLRKTHHISDISDTQYSPMPHPKGSVGCHARSGVRASPDSPEDSKRH